MSDKIRCSHCGSSLVIKCEGYVGVRPIPLELVDDWSNEADDTMGKETLFYIYRCSACGKECYEEVREDLVS